MCSPGLVNLFNDVQGVAVHRMKADSLEFHPPQHVARIACLGGYPCLRVGSGLPDDAR
jgi:hypothetical protein